MYQIPSFFLISLFIYLFIYFWLRWVFVAARELSLVVVSRGYSSLWCAVFFSLQWLLMLRSTGSRRAGFSSCGSRAQQLWLVGSRAQAQQLWHTGLVARRHVGSSRTRDRTHVPCIGRRILNHCTTKEALLDTFCSPLLLGSMSTLFYPVLASRFLPFKVTCSIGFSPTWFQKLLPLPVLQSRNADRLCCQPWVPAAALGIPLYLTYTWIINPLTPPRIILIGPISCQDPH